MRGVARVRVWDSVRVSVGRLVEPSLVEGKVGVEGGGVSVGHNPRVVPPSYRPYLIARAGAIRLREAGGAEGCGVTSVRRIQRVIRASRDGPRDTALCAAAEPGACCLIAMEGAAACGRRQGSRSGWQGGARGWGA